MRGIALFGLVLLAACGGREVVQRAPDSPEAAACRREARNAPERQALMQRRFSSNARQIDQELAVVENRAFRACLRQRGVTTGDGVEAVRR